ncbi:substrate-binding domain-containing protein [Alkalicoccus chagannorensis]|uniref:substrate-binding domain-containing protein n=1 Tax=Alkalicoccus chagannorensis TaxID=427072 RepID=UPI000402A22D|nr:substrate-binding domain-containing protein [Alkalicoccus chagannorensis]
MRKAWGLIAASALVTLAACGNDDNNNGTAAGSSNNNEAGSNNEAEESAEGSDGDISGTVNIDGSGTVYPLMSRVAEGYMTEENPEVSIEVSRAGTSAGMQRYVEGETDFANASRTVSDEEEEMMEENGIESMEFPVALDGMTIVTHPDNDWAEEMTVEEVESIFVSGAVNDDDEVMWSDIRDEWPEEEINTYGPNENHGTYEFFIDELIDGQDLKDGTNLQQEYPTLVELVNDDEYAFGFFGFGYYENNSDALGVVSIDFGDGHVTPSLDTIDLEGDYAPYTREVFTNINLDSLRDNPAVGDFADYVFNNVDTFAPDTGFAPLPEEQLQEQLEEIQSIE